MNRYAPLLLAAVLLAGCGTIQPDAQGVVECDEETLAFEVSGTIVETPVAGGARVMAGALLARLDSTALRLAAEEAEAQLELARRELALTEAPARKQELIAAEADATAATSLAATAAAERERLAQLHARGLASDADRDRAADAAASAGAQARGATERLALLREGPRVEAIAAARARVAVAELAAARARERRDRTVLVAPGDRLVRHRHRERGEMVQPGIPVVTLVDLDRPYVDAFVPQARLAALRVGGKVSVRIDGAAAVEGLIERIGERLEFTPRFLFGPKDRPDLVARVRVRLASGSRFHAGVPADVTFVP